MDVTGETLVSTDVTAATLVSTEETETIAVVPTELAAVSAPATTAVTEVVATVEGTSGCAVEASEVATDDTSESPPEPDVVPNASQTAAALELRSGSGGFGPTLTASRAAASLLPEEGS